ncbi:unnamed protein product, partial [Prunus brigantina]
MGVLEVASVCVPSLRLMGMFDSQETPSSGSVSGNDKDDENVMDQIYEAADQMGEGMRIGLGGNFVYQGVRSGRRGE